MKECADRYKRFTTKMLSMLKTLLPISRRYRKCLFKHFSKIRRNLILETVDISKPTLTRLLETIIVLVEIQNNM